MILILIFIGSILRGISGVGSAILVTSVGAHIIGFDQAVLLAALTDLFGNLFILSENFKAAFKIELKLKKMAVLAILAAIGSVGLATFIVVDISTAAALIVLLSCIFGLSPNLGIPTKFISSETRLKLAYGSAILAGISSIFSGLPGPFARLSVDLSRISPGKIHHIAYILLPLAFIRLWVFKGDVGLTGVPILFFLTSLFTLVLGIYIGRVIVKAVSPQTVNLITYIICAISALLLLVK